MADALKPRSIVLLLRTELAGAGYLF